MNANGTNVPRTISEMFPSKYVKAIDLQGRPYTVHISNVEVRMLRQFDGTSAYKVVLTFHNANKPMILNKTQCRSMAEITGTEVFEKWAGHTIQVSPAKAPNGKDTIAILPAEDVESEPFQEATEAAQQVEVTVNGHAPAYVD